LQAEVICADRAGIKKEGVQITLTQGTAKHPAKNVKERPKYGSPFNIVSSLKIGCF
jgi:hypothetical protein